MVRKFWPVLPPGVAYSTSRRPPILCKSTVMIPLLIVERGYSAKRKRERRGSASAFLLRAFGSCFEYDRRAPEAEPAADLVDQITLVAEMQGATPIGERDKFRRPDGRLGHVVDLALLKAQLFDEAVELAGWNAPRGRFVDLADERKQALDAGAGFGGEERHRGVLQKLELVADLALELIPFLPFVSFYFIPFIDADDDAAAAFVSVARDGGIEADDALGGIEHQQHHVGHADVPAGHDHAQLFGHGFGLALAADARGVDEDVLDAVACDGFIHGIAGGSGDGGDDGPLGAGERVEQGRFADVGAANDRDLNVIRRRVRAGGGAGNFRGSVGEDAIEQGVDAGAVLAGDGEHVGDAELVELVREVLARSGIGLIDRERDGLAQLAQHGREVAVRGGDFGAAIDQKNDVGGAFERDLRLPQDLAGDVFAVIDDNAAGVDDFEAAAIVLGKPVDAVPRDPRLIADDCAPLSCNAIK